MIDVERVIVRKNHTPLSRWFALVSPAYDEEARAHKCTSCRSPCSMNTNSHVRRSERCLDVWQIIGPGDVQLATYSLQLSSFTRET